MLLWYPKSPRNALHVLVQCIVCTYTESGPPLATGPSLLLKGDSLQLTGLVTGALLRDLRAAYCGLHAGDDEDSLRDAAAHPNAREAFNELLMHFYHHAAMDG